MKEFIKNNRYTVILWVVCLAALVVFTGHYENILLDIGREVYYPERILDGKILYKDLFNIYGPVSYQWNAFLYAILGKNLRTLYISGALSSFAIVSAIFLISKKFFNNGLSFALGLFAIASGICATHLFNFTLPYSFAMLYGIVGFLYSLLFALKYQETKNSNFLYLSGLLAGFAAANKYDFLLYGVFLFVFACFTKNIKTILKFTGAYLVVPLISFGILFIQGLRIENLIETADIVSQMAKSSTLKYFYSIQGIFFNKQMPALWAISILKNVFLFAGLMFGVKFLEKNKYYGWIIISLFAILTTVLTTPANYTAALPALLIGSLFCIKKFRENPKLLILVSGVLSVSVKSFLSLIPLNYGSYFTAIVFTAVFALLLSYQNKKYEKAAAIFTISTAVFFAGMFTYNRFQLNEKISTLRGTIYTSKYEAPAANLLIDYVKEFNVKEMVIYPEGLLLNFLTGTKSEDRYNSMIPLYEEVFGDKSFVEYFSKNHPDYFVLNNLNTKDYYYETICVNYAFDFCKFTATTSKPFVDINKHGRRYLIYEKI